MKLQILASAILAVGLYASAGRAQETEVSFREKALSLNSVTGDEAITGKLRELRKDKEALKKLLAEAKSIAKEKPKSHPFNYNASYILARSAYLIKEYDSGEFFYKISIEHAFNLKSSQKLAQVFDGLIDLFERAKKYDDAFFTCQKFLELKSDDNDDSLERVKPFIIEKMIQVLCYKKDFDKALEMTQKMVDADKGGWYFLHRKAEVLREKGDFDDSAKLFEEVIEKIKNNENLEKDSKARFVDQCKYVLSSVYLDQGNFDKSMKTLEELVAARPKSATFANDLGYILADHNKRLDEAEKLIEKALELDREDRKEMKEKDQLPLDQDTDNSAYIDSLAWVHFRKKNYPKALELMEQVVKSEDSQHVEIYDHFAEVLLASGKKDEAVKAWEKALTLDNQSRRDDARKEAIKKKLADNK